MNRYLGLKMRVFSSADGRSWCARIDVGADEAGAPSGGVGWEAVLFEPHGEDPTQRLTYRPAGWLAGASDEDLIEALAEAEAVRARWGEPQRAGT